MNPINTCLLLALPASVLILTACSGCTSSTGDGPSAEGIAGSGSQAGTGGSVAGQGGAGAGASGTGSAGNGPVSAGAAGTSSGGTAGSFSGEGDPGWKTFDWLTRCSGVEYAEVPANAAPRLKWIPCEGDIPGCTRLDASWERARTNVAPITPYPFFLQQSGKRYFAASVNYRDEFRLDVLYEDDEPVFVTRDNSEGCGFTATQPTPSGVCSIVFPPAGEFSLTSFDWRSPAAPGKYQWDTTADTNLGCFDTHRVASDAAGDLSMMDLQTGAPLIARWEGGDGVKLSATAYETHTLTIRSAGMTDAPIQDGWQWMPDGRLLPLVSVPDKALLSLLSEGETVAWVQVPIELWGTTIEGSGELWKSSFVPGTGAITPVKVADIEMASMGNHAMGAGLYGLIATPANFQGRLHVYRLSDGRHWELPRLPNHAKPGDDSETVPVELLRLTDDEIWWRGAPQVGIKNVTIVRQSLSAL